MELIFIILIIVSIVSAANKNKQNTPGQPGSGRPVNPAGPQTPQPGTPVAGPPRGAAPQKPMAAQKTPMQEEYERFLKRQAARDAFSPEGKPSSEGECIEPNPNHCVVEHSEDAAYSQNETELDAIDKQELVKGILWSEILGKPKCMR